MRFERFIKIYQNQASVKTIFSQNPEDKIGNAERARSGLPNIDLFIKKVTDCHNYQITIDC